MKLVLSYLLLCLGTAFTLNAYEGYAYKLTEPQITWLNSYEVAVNESKATNRPMLLFFTGSDWCASCHKLESEVFDTHEFALEAGKRFVFVKLDFPLNSTHLPTQIIAQNKQLQKKYEVTGFPTVVLLDSTQQQIGTVRSHFGGGKSYAQHLFKMVDEYNQYRSQTQNLTNQNLNAFELRRLYEKSKELGRENEAQQIIKLGLNIEDNHFFLIERYRFLAEEGKNQEPEAIALKQRLLSQDPQNENLTYYQIAVIDFERCCEQMEKEHLTAKRTVQPLIEYVEKFGHQDKQNLWRLQMIISQVYFDHNNLAEALKYAEYSYQTAPSAAQAEIATAIKGIQTRLNLSTR